MEEHVDNENEDKSKKDISLTESFYLNLLAKTLGNIEEERMLALDRFRRADEQMDDEEHFAMLGKVAVQFLDLGAKRTNSMIDISKELQKLIFKEDEVNTDSRMDGGKKEAFSASIKQMESEGDFSDDLEEDGDYEGDNSDK